MTVLSLPWTGRGQRDGEEREEKDAGTERQLGGKVECSTIRQSPYLIICIIAAFRFLDGTLEQKDICARLTFKEYPNFYRENVPKERKERRWRHFTKVRGGESPRARYTNMETKRKENGKLQLQRISRGHRFTRASFRRCRRLPHPRLKSTHKTPEWE